MGRTSLSRWWVATAARRVAARGECAAISSGGLLHSGNSTGGRVSWLTLWLDLTPVAGQAQACPGRVGGTGRIAGPGRTVIVGTAMAKIFQVSARAGMTRVVEPIARALL